MENRTVAGKKRERARKVSMERDESTRESEQASNVLVKQRKTERKREGELPKEELRKQLRGRRRVEKPKWVSGQVTWRNGPNVQDGDTLSYSDMRPVFLAACWAAMPATRHQTLSYFSVFSHLYICTRTYI